MATPDYLEILQTRFGDQYKGRIDRSEGLPQIVDSVRKDLLGDLNLDLDIVQIQRMIVSGDGPVYPPYLLAMAMAGEEFAFLYSHAEVFMNATEGWLSENFKGNIDAANCAATGVALVLKAFRVQDQQGYMAKLSEIKRADDAEASKLLEGGRGFVDRLAEIKGGQILPLYNEIRRPLDESRSIVLRAKSNIAIPPYQFNLQFCIDKLGAASPDFSIVQHGAKTVYSVLSKLYSH